MRVRSGGFDFQSRRFFAFAQTYDDLQGHGSRLEVILPCPFWLFIVPMSYINKKKRSSPSG